MQTKALTSSATPRRDYSFLTAALLLAAVVSLLLSGALSPGHTLASNDGPLGRLMSQCNRMPGRFYGCWEDLNTVGYSGGGAPLNISFILQTILKPIAFSKLYALIGLVILGLGAWYCFRRLRLAPLACLLGALATTLNSGFFSTACWGVASQTISIDMTFFALGLLVHPVARWRWLRVAAAGFAVGMGVAEGADIGAIFSVLVSAFVLYQAWVAEGPRERNVVKGIGELALVAACAVFLATQAVTGFVTAGVKGTAGNEQDAEISTDHWDWATKWSLPLPESLGMVVPGLFGYRMDTLNGGRYWGAIGRDAAWERYFESGKRGRAPDSTLRFSGGGCYAGVIVVLVAFWAAAQSFGGRNSIFSPARKKHLRFWIALGVVSFLMALGRHAPFYRWFYALPYASTMRNPIKFLGCVGMALMILFAYGVDGIWRRYMQSKPDEKGEGWQGLMSWWKKAGPGKGWIQGCLVILGLSLLAWLLYANSRRSLENYLFDVMFTLPTAQAIAAFSIRQVGWFVLALGLATGLLALIFSGAFRGPRARWGGAFLALLVIGDLARANQPWIVIWDYKDMYASDPILDYLRKEPFEHRVTILPFREVQATLLNKFYRSVWLQQQFPFYNIQSLNVVQLARAPADLAAFQEAVNAQGLASITNAPRFWELTNTRFIIGPADNLGLLNDQVDPPRRRFRVVERFDLEAKPGILNPILVQEFRAVPATNGACALFEFTGALPRARLYSNWQIVPDFQSALAQVLEGPFDPENTVLVTGGLPAAPSLAGVDQNDGEVQFVNYSPKDILLKCDAPSGSVLLLNDRFDPNWKVRVDGKEAPLLRCNCIMRGVFLVPGPHQVEFYFRPPVWPLYVSLTAFGLAMVTLGFLVVVDCRAISPAVTPQSNAQVQPASGQSPPQAVQKEQADKRTPLAAKTRR